MEMYQVRYFLALGKTLNFTRAAEECNVAQPSLSRAIKQLEAELGGELFRRERPQALMTELGQRMLPILKQCFDSANSARALAALVGRGGIGALRIALSQTIELALLMPHIDQLKKLFGELQLVLLRPSSPDAIELLQSGDVDLTITTHNGEGLERLDKWSLFDEDLALCCSRNHRSANRAAVDRDDLRDERFIFLRHDEEHGRVAALLRNSGLALKSCHETSSVSDLIQLVAANIGVTLLPCSLLVPESLVRLPVARLDFRRTVHLYAISGRERTASVSTFLKLLRAANWSRSMNVQAAYA